MRSEATFTPENPSGTVTVTFEFDSKYIKADTDIVVFESLYQEGRELAAHADIEDKSQTVTVHVPEIGTQATIGEEKEVTIDGPVTIDDVVSYKNLTPGKELTIEDVVSYKNLNPGTEYKLVGVLMDKATGNPFKVGDKEVTAETVVKLTFDGSGITQATELVVFETLYQGEVKIAAHEDINDEGQTVKIVPVTPGKPTTPNLGNPQTGDRSIMGCHTALDQIQTCFTGVKWFVEGDIKGFFDNIDHEIMIGILSERIKDQRFLRLIRKFLKAGYLEDWQYHKTYSGTPQGSIISPILANIYLDRLDCFMEKLKKKFDSGKDNWKAKARFYLKDNDPLEILDQYNSEVRGFRNYYRIANNSSHANSFGYIMQYSMFKTFSTKYRLSMRRTIKKLRIGKNFGVHFTTKKGNVKTRLFYHDGFAREKKSGDSTVDLIPNTVRSSSKTSLMDRLSAQQCELCGRTDVDIEIHHGRKLKDLKGKTYWERFMIARNRKTLALCKECHTLLHAGKLS